MLSESHLTLYVGMVANIMKQLGTPEHCSYEVLDT